MTDSQTYQSGDQLEAIVRGFEDCTMPDSDFSHQAHLVVAFSYLQLYRLTIEEAAALAPDDYAEIAAARVAGIRETLEETGLALALQRTGEALKAVVLP